MRNLSKQERRRRQMPVPQCAIGKRATHPPEGLPITNYNSRITAFLIDTTTIRFAPKPIDCIAIVAF